MDDGRRVTVSAKVSEAVAVALDDARGDVSRSAYLGALLADHLGSRPAATLKRRREPVKRGGQAAPARVPDLPVTDSPPEPGRRSAAPADDDGKPCRHSRKLKGWCRECGTGGL